MAKPKKKATDWEAIEREYRAGQLSVSEIARQHGISHTAINKKAKAEGWVKNLAKQVRDEVSARLVSSEVSSVNVRETIDAAAARGVEVVRSHRAHLARLNRVAGELLTRVEMVLGLREIEGNPRMVFGEKESPADVMEKVSRTLQRAIPLERQAFSLDEPGAKDNATTLSPEQVRRMAQEVAAQE